MAQRRDGLLRVAQRGIVLDGQNACQGGFGRQAGIGHQHCQPLDPNGKLDIVKHAGFWLRDEKGNVTRKFQHICWDGCMFPNAVMGEQKTWKDILGVMAKVRDAHGWD